MNIIIGRMFFVKFFVCLLLQMKSKLNNKMNFTQNQVDSFTEDLVYFEVWRV